MSENSTLGLLVGFLVCLGFLGGGVYLFAEDVRAVDTYEKTEATVLSTGVDSGTDVGEHYVEVTYEYTVDGRIYESSNVYPGPGQVSKSEFEAEDVVEQYPEGETVTAYYDPKEPSNAFLIKKRNVLMPLLMVGMGGLTSLAFGAALVKRVLGFAV